MPLIGFAFTDAALDFIGALPPKIRRQVVKKAKALLANPFSPTCKKLRDVETPEGDPVYRERSGDYRILYAVRSKPHREVLILNIANRKDAYRMPKTKTDPADDMRMKQGEFDDIMRNALGVSPPEKTDEESEQPHKEKRLSAYPRRAKKD